MKCFISTFGYAQKITKYIIAQILLKIYVKVDIYFSAVGMIDIPTAEEIRAMIEEIKKDPQQFRYVA